MICVDRSAVHKCETIGINIKKVTSVIAINFFIIYYLINLKSPNLSLFLIVLPAFSIFLAIKKKLKRIFISLTIQDSATALA